MDAVAGMTRTTEHFVDIPFSNSEGICSAHLVIGAHVGRKNVLLGVSIVSSGKGETFLRSPLKGASIPHIEGLPTTVGL